MWYVIQTLTGKEEELVKMIRETVPSELYHDCFVIYYERFWRKQQQSIVHVERLFPGYVFVDTEEAEGVFHYLKKIPMMSNLMRDGEYTFLNIYSDEEEMLRHLLETEGNYIIRLSYVEKAASGKIQRIVGPLSFYQDQVERYQFKKRYAIIRISLLGKEQSIILGILLKEDVRQELQSGKVDIPRVIPEISCASSHKQGIEQNELSLPDADTALFSIGCKVVVKSGALQGMKGIVWRIHASRIEVGIRLLGQDIGVEVDKDELDLLDQSTFL